MLEDATLVFLCVLGSFPELKLPTLRGLWLLAVRGVNTKVLSEDDTRVLIRRRRDIPGNW